uniref:Uncharacterized protein n=1 Tax=viral metagenome TaxID=1070528 RepID=A0A6M3M057_9ZZZZ
MIKEKRTIVVERLFQFWLDIMGKNPKRTVLSTKRRRKIEDRLKEGWDDPERMIRDAIKGCYHSDFHMGRGRHSSRRKTYNDLELICRDAEHVEAFVERYDEHQKQHAQHLTDDQAYPWEGRTKSGTRH